MKALYTRTSITGKLKKAFFEIFSEEGRHTKEHLFDMLVSVLCLNGFRSVSYNFEHFIEPVSDNRLKGISKNPYTKERESVIIEV